MAPSTIGITTGVRGKACYDKIPKDTKTSHESIWESIGRKGGASRQEDMLGSGPRQLDRRLGGLQNWSGCCGAEKSLLSLPGSKPWPPSPWPVTIPTELSQLHLWKWKHVMVLMITISLLHESKCEDSNYHIWLPPSPAAVLMIPATLK
jgi:hypothetical protein